MKMLPHEMQNLPKYLARFVPELRPAFEHDIFFKNGRFKVNTFFQFCPSCNVTHSVEIFLPKFEKADSKIIRGAKKRAYIEASNFYREIVKDGDIYVSTNNIDFIIQINLN